MKNCPYCYAALYDNMVQCNVCGFIFQQQSNQGQYNARQYQNQQNLYTARQYQPTTQQGYAQQQNQYYPQQYGQQYINKNQYTPYSQSESTAVTDASNRTKVKKQRPLWVKVLIGIAVTIGVIWALYDGFAGAEMADEWLGDSSSSEHGSSSERGSSEDEILIEIAAILDSTQVSPIFSPTIGQCIVMTFSSFDITYEHSEGTEYIVSISGSYKPSPDYAWYVEYGTIEYLVDIEKNTCRLHSDPEGIERIFIVHIVS